MIAGWLVSIAVFGAASDPALTFERLESAAPDELALLIPAAAAPPGTWIEKRATRAPSLARESADAATVCGGHALSEEGGKDPSITAGKDLATLSQAAFAVRMIAETLKRPARCRGADANFCVGIASRSLDLRQMYRLSLISCGKDRRRWCVRGQLDRPRGDGPVFIDTETGTTVGADLDTAPIVLRSVRLTTDIWPIA